MSKTKKMWWLIATLLITYSQASMGDVGAEIISHGFVEAPLPVENALLKANNSRKTFKVWLEGSKLAIAQWGENDASDHISRYKFEGVRYEGLDNGEWGGELNVTLQNGTRQVLLKENVQAIVPASNTLLIFTGLAHLSVSHGAVYRVRNPGAAPSLERITLLPDAPAVIVPDARYPDRERFLIVGASSLMGVERMSGVDSLEIFLSNQFWWALYPNSAVIHGNALVIGARSGLVTVDLEPAGWWERRTVHYYVPKEGAKQ